MERHVQHAEQQSPQSELKVIHSSPAARVLGAILVALVFVAIGAAAVVGLVTFAMFFVLLVPVLMLLVVAALVLGRGRFNVYVYRPFRTPKRRADRSPVQNRDC